MSSKPQKKRVPTTAELEGLFRFFSMMAPISREQFLEFSQHLVARYYSKGDFFVQIGDTSRNVGFVLKGGFSVSYLTIKGEAAIRNFCIEGMPVGTFATILSNIPAHVNIEAFDDTLVIAVDYDKFESFFEKYPLWERIGRKIAEQHYISREKREYQLLTLDAKARYKQFLVDFPNLNQRVKQSMIAAYIGVTPVSLSRLLGQRASSK